MPYFLLGYYTRWVIGEDSNDASTIFVVGALSRLFAQLLGIPIWAQLAQKPGWGKIRAFVVGSVCL